MGRATFSAPEDPHAAGSRGRRGPAARVVRPLPDPWPPRCRSGIPLRRLHRRPRRRRRCDSSGPKRSGRTRPSPCRTNASDSRRVPGAGPRGHPHLGARRGVRWPRGRPPAHYRRGGDPRRTRPRPHHHPESRRGARRGVRDDWSIRSRGPPRGLRGHRWRPSWCTRSTRRRPLPLRDEVPMPGLIPKTAFLRHPITSRTLATGGEHCAGAPPSPRPPSAGSSSTRAMRHARRAALLSATADRTREAHSARQLGGRPEDVARSSAALTRASRGLEGHRLAAGDNVVWWARAEFPSVLHLAWQRLRRA